MQTYSKISNPIDETKNISLHSKIFSSFSPTQNTFYNETDQTWSGNISWRFSQSGTYYIFLTHTNQKNVLSPVHRIVVFVSLSSDILN